MIREISEIYKSLSDVEQLDDATANPWMAVERFV